MHQSARCSDFSVGDQSLVKRIQTNYFSRELWFFMPGQNPESAIRELAKIDFDDAISQVNVFTDKVSPRYDHTCCRSCLFGPLQRAREKPLKKAKT